MQEYRPRELSAIDIGWSIEVRIPLDAHSDGLVARATFLMTICADKGDPDRKEIAARLTERGIEEGELSSWVSGDDEMSEAEVLELISRRGMVASDIVSMTIERVEFADQTIASARIF